MFIRLVLLSSLMFISVSPALGLGAEPFQQPPAVDSGETNPDVASRGSLEERVKELEAQVRRLLEEAKVRESIAPDQQRDEKEEEKIEEVLKAAVGKYSLLPKGNVRLTYGLNYSYYASDVVEDYKQGDGGYTVFVINHAMEHSFTNTISVDYGLRDNLTLNGRIPFVFKYDEVSENKGNDLGDLSFGVQYQPMRSRVGWPAINLTGNLTLPTGTNPYEVNPRTEFATGSGTYSLSGGVNMSKSIDPLVVYGGVAYTWRPLAIKNIQSGGRDIDSLTLGDSFSVNAGIGFSLSYGVSLNLGYSLSHSFGSELEINGQTQKSTGQNQSVFTVGTSWRLSSGQYLNTSIGMGLTPQSPDFSINVSLPFEFSGF